MRYLKKTNIPLVFVMAGYLLFGFTPISNSFLSIKHQLGEGKPNILMEKVHDKHWDIVYAYGANCPEEKRANAKKFEEAIAESLNILLQPLREIETKAPIVNEFRFQQVPEISREIRAGADLVVTDTCAPGRSNAALSGRFPPLIMLNVGADMGDTHMNHLIHELGHAIGLGDTYVGRNEAVLSATKGGMKRTVGTQPASIMGSFRLFLHKSQYISEDDEKGIVWFYKVIHEGLAPNDCFFSDYKFQKSPNGCVPKHPLIFEVKQGHEEYALQILNEDRSINVNARDESGSTALHYAVMNGSTEVVDALLSHENIWVRPRNKAGYTPIELARKLGDGKTAELLLNHPNQALEVAAKHKLATTWGSLKRRD